MFEGLVGLGLIGFAAFKNSDLTEARRLIRALQGQIDVLRTNVEFDCKTAALSLEIASGTEKRLRRLRATSRRVGSADKDIDVEIRSLRQVRARFIERCGEP